MTTLTFPHAVIIIDASSLINLCGSRRIVEIIEAVPVQVAIAEYVYSVEALTVHADPELEEDAPENIDLQPIILSGKLNVELLRPGDEQITTLSFARDLGDDGEAHTGAIAVHRNWAIAIDDRSATQYFRRVTPQLQIITTPELVKHWVDVASPPEELVRKVLHDVRVRGRYNISKQHSLYTWWQSSS